MKLFSLLTFILFLIQLTVVAYGNDVDSEKKLLLLEAQLKSKIQSAIHTILSLDNIHISAKVNLLDSRTIIEKNFEANRFDYLPLIVKDGVRTKGRQLIISSYQIRVVSSSKVSSANRAKIEELISGELRGRKFTVQFDSLSSPSFAGQVVDGWRSFVKSTLFYGILITVGTIFAIMFILLIGRYLIKKLKSGQGFLNKIHESNIEDLVKFIRSNVEKDGEILRRVVKDKKVDVLGVKSLIPYLGSKFDIDKIISKAILVRVGNENGHYSNKEFINWLKGISERVTTDSLRNSSKKKKVVAEIPKVPKNVDPHAKVSNDDIDALFNTENKQEVVIEPSAVVTNDDLDALFEMVKADNRPDENVQELKWGPDKLTMLPPSYLSSKLSGRDNDEIVALLQELSDSNRYFMISNMPTNKVNCVVAELEKQGPGLGDKGQVDSFFDEVNSDYQEGKFQLDDKKVA